MSAEVESKWPKAKASLAARAAALRALAAKWDAEEMLIHGWRAADKPAADAMLALLARLDAPLQKEPR